MPIGTEEKVDRRVGATASATASPSVPSSAADPWRPSRERDCSGRASPRTAAEIGDASSRSCSTSGSCTRFSSHFGSNGPRSGDSPPWRSQACPSTIICRIASRSGSSSAFRRCASAHLRRGDDGRGRGRRLGGHRASGPPDRVVIARAACSSSWAPRRQSPARVLPRFSLRNRLAALGLDVRVPDDDLSVRAQARRNARNGFWTLLAISSCCPTSAFCTFRSSTTGRNCAVISRAMSTT